MTRRISYACGLLLIVGLVVTGACSQTEPQTSRNDDDTSQHATDDDPRPLVGNRNAETPPQNIVWVTRRRDDDNVFQHATDGDPHSQTGERDDEALLLRIAQHYRIWGRVDEDPGWALVDCAMPRGPSQARLSQAEESTPHGQKLYFLYARNQNTYLAQGIIDPETGELVSPLQPVTQVVVKEAWRPVEVDAEEAQEHGRHYSVELEDKIDIKGAESSDDGHVLYVPFGNGMRVHPYVERDGVTYRADKLTGLFIMAKVSDEEVEGTDNGWIYGTVSTDGEVTSVGRVESCMNCHQEANNDRLFGLDTQIADQE